MNLATDTLTEPAVAIPLGLRLSLVVPLTLSPVLVHEPRGTWVPIYVHAAADLGFAIGSRTSTRGRRAPAHVAAGPGVHAEVDDEGDVWFDGVDDRDAHLSFFGEDLRH